MHYGLTQSAAPATEPVTQAEAKAHLRVDWADENDLIDSLIAAARGYVETATGRQLVTATWQLTLDRFPAWEQPIYLPRPPAASVTSISYNDLNGDAQTWTNTLYDTDFKSIRGRITPAYGEIYPSTRTEINAVTVTYTAGYGAAAAVPDTFKSAIFLVIADLFQHRAAGNELRITPNPAVAALIAAGRVVDG